MFTQKLNGKKCHIFEYRAVNEYLWFSASHRYIQYSMLIKLDTYAKYNSHLV